MWTKGISEMEEKTQSPIYQEVLFQDNSSSSKTPKRLYVCQQHKKNIYPEIGFFCLYMRWTYNHSGSHHRWTLKECITSSQVTKCKIFKCFFKPKVSQSYVTFVNLKESKSSINNLILRTYLF